MIAQPFFHIRLLLLQHKMQGPALKSHDVDICERIRHERRSGNTRCGVIEGKMTVVEAARAFGLADDVNYRSIGRAEADRIATRVLSVDLAYDSQMMSASNAAELWRQFMAMFEGQDVALASNAGTQSGSWTSATSATFDMGVLVLGVSKTGCLWVEDED